MHSDSHPSAPANPSHQLRRIGLSSISLPFFSSADEINFVHSLFLFSPQWYGCTSAVVFFLVLFGCQCNYCPFVAVFSIFFRTFAAFLLNINSVKVESFVFLTLLFQLIRCQRNCLHPIMCWKPHGRCATRWVVSIRF